MLTRREEVMISEQQYNVPSCPGRKEEEGVDGEV